MFRLFSSKTAAAIALAVLLSMVPGSAATIDFTFSASTCSYNANAGLCTDVAGAHTITFDKLAGSTSSFTDGIAMYSLTGAGSPFVNGSVDSQFAAPPNDQTDYLSVGSPNRPNPVTITFAVPINYFGFYLGSPDTYNTVKFYDGDTLVPVGGTQWFAPGNGDQSVGRYLNFNVHGGAINRIVMESSQAAFETDNHAYATVPEPSGLALLGLGLAGLYGYAARRMKRS